MEFVLTTYVAEGTALRTLDLFRVSKRVAKWGLAWDISPLGRIGCGRGPGKLKVVCGYDTKLIGIALKKENLRSDWVPIASNDEVIVEDASDDEDMGTLDLFKSLVPTNNDGLSTSFEKLSICVINEGMDDEKVILPAHAKISISRFANNKSTNSDSFDEPIYSMEDDEELEPFPELINRLKEEEPKLQHNQSEIETINLGKDVNKKKIKINGQFHPDERKAPVDLLKEFQDVFAWSYEDMPQLDLEIIVYAIPLKPECLPVKQKFRRMKPETLLKIKEEVKKLLDVGFIEVAMYPQWVANIVPVPKKDGKVRMCVDYRDLNKTSPKDDFPLPYIQLLDDNAAKSVKFSFVDGYSGYNQIKMKEEDKIKTTFITLWGTFCYKVIPFGLKNMRATYRRATIALLHDLIHKIIEIYVDGMIIRREFKIDHAKTKAIEEMPPLKTQKEVHNFLEPFDKIKQYLKNPPILVPPVDRRPLILYMIVFEGSIGAILAQHNDSGRKERAICYVRKSLMIVNVENAVEDYQPVDWEFPDEDIMVVEESNYKTSNWKMYFDEAANQTGSGVGAVLISSKGEHFPFVVKLDFSCTNNITEYKACILVMTLLRCVDAIEAKRIMMEAQEGICGTHANGHMLARKILRA
ncbi:hypothetical protein SLEP1_g47619 [Rubroshorea leprosula]|uniref:Reverse transcriptase domain-containing protein n=1 Tax=Rubroshorea leprosula TaxID=152421 RepID=A0AAV5LR37_9ROSI|nr:hypothetical protein SLEP1_g47619 [Rubroshorea leprosula]